MDEHDNDYELERQKIIAENRALLDSLGFEQGGKGTAALNLAKPKPAALAKARSGTPDSNKKRKTASSGLEEGPRRRSGRLAGAEATAEEVKAKVEEEEKVLMEVKLASRRIREQVMRVEDMMTETSPEDGLSLKAHLASVAPYQRRQVSAKDSAADAYAAPNQDRAADVEELRSHFQGMQLRANTKVTPERAYTMAVHPDPARTLVCVGDKHGSLGIWDALGKEEAKTEEDAADEEQFEGRVWQIQAHSRNSISCIKFDPSDAQKLYTSSYDCTLRSVDFPTGVSTEVFALNHDDDDMLINHFDLTPDGHQAWLADRMGGITHVDFRERHGHGSRARRWVVQEDGRASKLGGLSVNPLMPYIIATAGNDQHLRIWDTRHLLALSPKASENVVVSAPETPNGIVKREDVKSEEDVKPTLSLREPWRNTYLSSSIPVERVQAHMESKGGKGLHRAAWQHGKSCSAAYWDPWGRRVLSTSYDDKLRIWSINPQSLLLDSPIDPEAFAPSVVIPHNCQTGRWLTILRAQWSLNTEVAPHYTVGNMKRSLDVVAGTGEKICSLWTDVVTAVPAVTASHPGRVDHVLGASTSGKVQLWTSAKSAEQ